MKILVVSDTHGRDSQLEEVVERESPFDMMIHCGDVEGREFFIEALADGPCYMVAGNNDIYCDLPRELEFQIGARKAFLTHGHELGVLTEVPRLAEAAMARGCEIAFFGHTHRPVVAEEGGVLVINPGSLAYPRQAGRKPSYVVMETHMGEITTEIRYLSSPVRWSIF